MDPKTLQSRTEEHFSITLKGRGNALKEIALSDLPTQDRVNFTPKMRPCEECQQMVTGRVEIMAYKQYEHRGGFWEIKCLECGKKKTAKSLTKLQKS